MTGAIINTGRYVYIASPSSQHLDMNIIHSSLLSSGGSSNPEAVIVKIGLVQFELAQDIV